MSIKQNKTIDKSGLQSADGQVYVSTEGSSLLLTFIRSLYMVAVYFLFSFFFIAYPMVMYFNLPDYLISLFFVVFLPFIFIRTWRNRWGYTLILENEGITIKKRFKASEFIPVSSIKTINLQMVNYNFGHYAWVIHRNDSLPTAMLPSHFWNKKELASITNRINALYADKLSSENVDKIF